MNYIDILLQEIADAGIYAVLTIFGFILFFAMYKFVVNKLESMMKTSIETIEKSYKNANASLNEYIERYNREHMKK